MKTKTSTFVLTLPSDTEIHMMRVFDAPRGLVYEVMTKPDHLVRWWGPRGTTMPVCEYDFRVGGAWRFVSRGSGVDTPFKGVIREIVAPERLVFTQIYDVEPWSDHESLVTVVLTEENGRTTISVNTLFGSREDRDAMVNSGMERGASESYDRLAELLATLS